MKSTFDDETDKKIFTTRFKNYNANIRVSVILSKIPEGQQRNCSD